MRAAETYRSARKALVASMVPKKGWRDVGPGETLATPEGSEVGLKTIGQRVLHRYDPNRHRAVNKYPKPHQGAREKARRAGRLG